MKFIRKNGRIIPIKEKGDSNKNVRKAKQSTSGKIADAGVKGLVLGILSSAGADVVDLFAEKESKYLSSLKDSIDDVNIKSMASGKDKLSSMEKMKSLAFSTASKSSSRKLNNLRKVSGVLKKATLIGGAMFVGATAYSVANLLYPNKKKK